jgi:hypothetical protein
MKFKINTKIESSYDKIAPRDKIILFNENISLSGSTYLRELYIDKREDDGWLYLDFIIEGHSIN